MTQAHPRRIAIAILALGGQGGGVLADWIVNLATREGWFAQTTSVPGVAQRTGSTIYYLELFPGLGGSYQPVLALSPVPGDVDVVIASELMEAGRAILRRLVTKDRTTLIASTNRIYAVSEKAAMGDGRRSSEKILETSKSRAQRFIGFDMEEAANHAGSMISAVMFGALAQSGALPFAIKAFEQSISEGGIAVKSNLAGFRAGMAGGMAQAAVLLPADAPPQPTTKAGRRLHQRVMTELPVAAHGFAIEGVRRLMDYQDASYADLYLDRLRRIGGLDPDGALTQETARYLALWMSYEDTIRVADLKIRKTRFARVIADVRAEPAQVTVITEFMHPRLQEVCETMPAWLGKRILSSKILSRALTPLFSHGRHVTTSSLTWFLILFMLAGLRRWRRGTLRYREEQGRIEAWLAMVGEAARTDKPVALELVQCQRLVKGYGDTFAWGLRSFGLVMAAYQGLRGQPDKAAVLRELRDAALKDENGIALGDVLARLRDTNLLQRA